MEDKILTKVKIIGDRYFHHFKMDDGSIEHIETTKDDYEQLAGKNPINPKIKNGSWKYSSITPKFDTENGFLNDLEYVDNGDTYMLKYDGKLLFTSKDNILEDKISSNILNELLCQ